MAWILISDNSWTDVILCFDIGSWISMRQTCHHFNKLYHHETIPMQRFFTIQCRYMLKIPDKLKKYIEEEKAWNLFADIYNWVSNAGDNYKGLWTSIVKCKTHKQLPLEIGDLTKDLHSRPTNSTITVQDIIEADCQILFKILLAKNDNQINYKFDKNLAFPRKQYHSLFALSCKCNSSKIINYLLSDQFKEILIIDKYEFEAAVEYCSFKILKKVIDKLNFELTIDELNRCLRIACNCPKTGINLFNTIKMLVDRGANVNHCDTAVGATPLHWAIERGRLDVVGILLNFKQIDVNVKRINHEQDTPLVFGIRIKNEYGNAAIAAQMIVDWTTNANKPLCMDATEYESKWRSKKTTPLIMALERDQSMLAKSLIDGGCNVEATNENGENALMVATRNGNIGICNLIVEKMLSKNKSSNHNTRHSNKNCHLV